MPSTPIISVIIPSYNSAQWLAETVASVRAQNFPDVEIIIIDDGSTDDTHAVVSRLRGDDLIYHHKTNAGLSAARNTGISLARGKYLQFLDADDTLLPGKFASQTQALEANPTIGLLAGETIRADERLQPIYLMTHEEGKLTDEAVSLRPCFPVHSYLLRREWAEKVSGFDESLKPCGDWDYYLRLNALGCEFHFHKNPVCIYRASAGSMSASAGLFTEEKLQLIDRYIKNTEWIRRAKQDAYLSGAVRYFTTNDGSKGERYIQEAFALNTGSSRNFAQRVINMIAFWALHPLPITLQKYFEQVRKILPDTPPELRELARDLEFFHEKYRLFANRALGREAIVTGGAKLAIRHPSATARHFLRLAIGKP